MQSLFPQSGIPKLQKATANISATPEMVQNAIVGALENSVWNQLVLSHLTT